MLDRIIISGLLLAVLLTWHYGDRSLAVNRAITVTEQRYQKLYDEQKTRALLSQAQLQLDADILTGKKDETIKVLNDSLNVAIGRLQERPSRKSDPDPTSNRKSCTGTALFREDAEFLAREASRADKVLIERNYYYDRYFAAKRELEALQRGTP